jgi:acyl carrier protein
MQASTKEILDLFKQADIIGVDIDNLSVKQSLAAQGIDSLELMSVLLNVEDVYGIKIPDDDVKLLVSIQAITDYLNERLPV